MQGARENPQSSIRIPRSLKDWLKERASKNRRSLNDEIVFRLERSMGEELESENSSA